MHAVQHLLLQIGDGTWQDVMLSAGNIFFCITFIPMLRHPERPPLLTCIPTGLALVAGGFIFATLHLWLTALTQTITGLQWLALVFKRSPKAASSLTDSSKRPFESSRWRTIVQHCVAPSLGEPRTISTARCPHCGEDHPWRPSDARLLDGVPPSLWVENAARPPSTLQH
jgi:hypothetical protein